MGTNRFRIRVHLLSFILLLGLFMYSSCVKEHMEQAHQKEALDVMASRGISISASLSCFFNHSISLLDTVIMNLSNINENQEFIGEFLKEYGIPLWNCTYIIDDGIEQTYFVPLYNGQTSLEITSLWFFHVSEGKIIYAPFRRDDSSIAGHEQCFVFDLLSYLVFGEENSSGLVFGEKSSLSRSYLITLYECTPVCVSSESGGEYWYEDCVYRKYWVDETWNWITVNPGTGGGGVIDGGGSNEGGNSSGNDYTSTFATQIFQNNNFSENSWEIVDKLLDEIQEICIGATLFNQIKEKLDGEKIGFQFVVSDGSGYVHSNRTLNIDVDQINSNALLHEMMHLYQTLTETEFSYESSLMNRELEARYAQYVYLQNKSYLARAPYECSEWNIMASINDYIDNKGHLREGSDNDSFAAFLEYQIIPIYHIQILIQIILMIYHKVVPVVFLIYKC